MPKVLVKKINSPKLGTKLACFDFDWTLVTPKEGRTFPKNVDDWKWYYPNAPKILQRLHKDGFTICIFSNQTKPWKFEQMQNVMKESKVPSYLITTMDKTKHKPNTDMFDHLQTIAKKEKIKINLKKSFFVGDALGRPTDHSDSDKVFAQAIGIKYQSPESMFTEKVDMKKIKKTLTKKLKKFLGDKKTTVIMVGYQGSGKSTVSSLIETMDDDYVVISGDKYKSSKRMISYANRECKENCIIFDATNPSKKKRKEYIDFADANSYYVKCIYMSTPYEEAFRRNMTRDDNKKIPKIAYNMYRKNFEEPSKDEGFDDILVL